MIGEFGCVRPVTLAYVCGVPLSVYFLVRCAMLMSVLRQIDEF